MKGSVFLILVVALLIPGCAAPFSKFYQGRTGGVDITTSPNVVLSKEEPKLFMGNNQEEDSIKMREDGYKLVGYSSFNGGPNVDVNDAIPQAQKVHAVVVIVYSQYTNTVSGTRRLSMPNTQTSSTSFSGRTYGSGGNTNFSGNAQTTTRGTTTTYIPYNVRRFDYLATYWIKLKKSAIIFGVSVQDLTTELRQELGSNKGLLIIAVIKGSPAFQADILRGDVLRRIGGIDLYGFETLQETVKKYQGQTVSVEIYRDGKKIEKKIKLNTRS